MHTNIKILFPTDFSLASANALRYTLHFADQINAQIQVLHVIEPEYEAVDLPIMVAESTRLKIETATKRMKQFITEGITQAEVVRDLDNYPSFSTNIELGDAANWVAKIAERDNADVIVMGFRDRHSRIDRWLGTVTTSVMEKSRVPVLVVPENCRYNVPKKMVYTSMFSEADPFRIWNAQRIMGGLPNEIYVLRVNEINDGLRKEDTPVDMIELKAYFKDCEPDKNIFFHYLPKGDVGEKLEKFANDFHADLLVMYRPERSLTEKLFRKSTTRHVVFNTVKPTLILK